jgi:translation initiation factor eIF-2B subunit delta
MLAHDRDIPVIVCCESIKFTDRVALDSIVGNEVAPAEELLSEKQETREQREGTVKKWKETPGLQILNVLYDVTPAEYVKMVVTEYGSLPPSSVPAVLRILEDSAKKGV